MLTNSYLSNAFSHVVSPSLSYVGMGIVIGLSVYALKKAYGVKASLKQKQMTNNNIITIIHATDKMTLDDKYITIKTHMDFVKEYETMDKNKDIHIIMHTVGGSLSSSEAICNCILNHRRSGFVGKIIMYIPYYSYSGGCMIALACDKVIMQKNAILGPCDAQQYVTGSHYSVASIIDTVKYKKDNKEKISENWLAGAYDANLCKERQLKYVKELVDCEVFTEEIGNKIYDEFFSGKYNHDQIFTTRDALSLGLNVEIVEVMPDMIKNFIDYLVV